MTLSGHAGCEHTFSYFSSGSRGPSNLRCSGGTGFYSPTGPRGDPRSISHRPPSSGRGFLGYRRRPRAAESKGIGDLRGWSHSCIFGELKLPPTTGADATDVPGVPGGSGSCLGDC